MEMCDAVAAAPRAEGRQAGVPRDLAQRREASPTPRAGRSEPIYGKTYLPRKFKVAFALPDDNCTDILAQCLGFLAIIENGKPVGYNLLRRRRAGADEQQAGHLPAARAAGRLRRPVGSRRGGGGGRASCSAITATAPTASGPASSTSCTTGDSRSSARCSTATTSAPGPRCRKHVPITGLDLHLGWHGMGDGKWFLGLCVENGRIKDDGTMRLRSGLRAIVSRFKADVRLTHAAGRAALRHRDRRPRQRSIRC